MTFKPPLSCEEIKAAFGDLFEKITMLPCGGQGAVFKCTHRPSNEILAVKIYFTNQVQQRTEREIDVIMALVCSL